MEGSATSFYSILKVMLKSRKNVHYPPANNSPYLLLDSLSDLEEFIKVVSKGMSIQVHDELEYSDLVSLIESLRVSSDIMLWNCFIILLIQPVMLKPFMFWFNS